MILLHFVAAGRLQRLCSPAAAGAHRDAMPPTVSLLPGVMIADGLFSRFAPVYHGRGLFPAGMLASRRAPGRAARHCAADTMASRLSIADGSAAVIAGELFARATTRLSIPATLTLLA